MAEFVLPELGEGIEDADVLKVLVAVGDTVAVDQPLLEIETEKATLDVPSSVAGTVTGVLVKPGDTIKVGQRLFTLDGAVATSAPAAAPPTVEAAAPQVVEAPVAEAPPAEPGLPPEADSPAPPGEGRHEVDVMFHVKHPGEVPTPPSSLPPFASPTVRRLAREIGVDIASVRGSGPGGRIDEGDVKRHAREAPRTAATASTAASMPAGVEVPPLPDFAAFGPIEREPLSRFRRTVARNMATSWAVVPHVTLHRSVDVTELEALRQRYKQRAADAGGSLTVTVILLKIVAAALKAYPRLNASLDMASNELILKRYCDIGVAVDTERGLTVPVIRGVDDKNIVELSVELSDLAERARTGALTVDEMRGGTFTLTNLGGMGVGEFTPIINYPEVAVLGVGRAQQVPVFVDGAWEPRLHMPLSLSHDHRIIDGADGARFLIWIAEAIAEPLLIALEG